MQSKVEISVVMSVYNSEKWLNESISSILNQTFKNFEFIIINDGSTDSSESIIKSFANTDDRIILINQANCGLTKSLNKGISISSGRYIARIDADDISLPDRLKKQYEILESSDNLGLCYSSFFEIDSSGKQLGKSKVVSKFDQVKRNLSKGVNNIAHSSVMFRKSIFESLNGYREKLKKSQDFDLWLRMMEITVFASTNDEALVLIRRHRKSITYNEFDVYMYISVLSFFARKESVRDPLTLPSKDYAKFYKWVNEYLVLKKENIKTKRRNQISFLLRQKNTRIIDFLTTLHSIILSKYSYIVILEKIFGYNIFNQFYKDWKVKYKYA